MQPKAVNYTASTKNDFFPQAAASASANKTEPFLTEVITTQAS